MRRVSVVTDSTACIPPQLAAALDITVLPLFLAFEQTTYRDGMADDAAEFYDALRTVPRPPTTAAPSPGAYAEAMLEAGNGMEAVVCITVSRQFSAMYDAAMDGAALAREQRPGIDVRVVDSGAAAMAQGFVALDAARAAQEGTSVDDVIARAEALMPRVQLLVALDTLVYLGRSGRVPKLIVWASSPLQVKPIVEFKGGVYRPVALVRTRKRAGERLLRELQQRATPGAAHICVHHTSAKADADTLAEQVEASIRPKELFVREFTQVMGVHTGPGLLGFAFYSDR